MHRTALSWLEFSSRRKAWRYLFCVLMGALFAAGFLHAYHWAREWQVQTDLLSKRQVASVEIKHKSDVMVALIFGESNAGNQGESVKGADRHVYNFYKGTLYRAEDPLLGGGRETSDFGSVWTRLSNMLIEQRLYEQVILVPMAVKESPIAWWTPGGALHWELLERIQEVQKKGFTFTHLLWHQGESDARRSTSPADYKRMFQNMLGSIRQQGISAPIFVSVATLCYSNKVSSRIQHAQEELVNSEERILPGPNMDSLGLAYRYDGCHFSNEGLDASARLWFEALTDRAAIQAVGTIDS